jgi:hypothetical protein
MPVRSQIAVEGCCHGELDTIYAAMQRLEAKEGVKIDLLICCGDFQARVACPRFCATRERLREACCARRAHMHTLQHYAPLCGAHACSQAVR